MSQRNVKIESVVKAIQPTGTFDGHHGTLYKFEYSMEDGAVLVANHKTNPGPFKVGDACEYEITGGNDYGEWGNVRKPGVGQFNKGTSQGSSSGNTDKRILYQVCLKEAAMLLMGNINIESAQDSEISQAVTGLAKQLFIDSEAILKEVVS